MLRRLGQPFSAFILMAGEIHRIFPAPIALASGHGNISICKQQPRPLIKLCKATKCLSPETDGCMEDPSPQEGTAKATPFTVRNINPSTFRTHRQVGLCQGDPHSADEPNAPNFPAVRAGCTAFPQLQAVPCTSAAHLRKHTGGHQ